MEHQPGWDNRRTAQAMLTMQETNRIMQSTAEDRRTTQWHQHLTGLIEKFPGRYRVVPSDHLKQISYFPA